MTAHFISEIWPFWWPCLTPYWILCLPKHWYTNKKTTVKLTKYSRCPLTSNYIKIFAKSIYYNDYRFFGGHFGRHLEFLKTLKGAKPAPSEILKSNVSPLRKYQNIYYTLPCHVTLKYIKYLPDYIWVFTEKMSLPFASLNVHNLSKSYYMYIVPAYWIKCRLHFIVTLSTYIFIFNTRIWYYATWGTR